MRNVLWIAAVAVTVFALSLDAIAQPGGQRGQGQGQGQRGQGAAQQPGQGMMGAQQTPQTLLRNEEVGKLLTLTEAQTTALNELFAQGRGAGVGQQGQQLTAAERVAQQRTRTAEQWAGIAKVLNAEQLKKFNDIYFQANVPVVRQNAPADAPVQIMNLNVYLLGAVDLTADQKEKIAKIANDRDDAGLAAGGFGGAQGGGQQLTQEERQARLVAARERNTKANDEILALLTAAQKAKIEELKAGAPALRTALGIGQRQPGAGAQPGAGERQPRGEGGAGFQPGQGSWQPGQGAPAAGGRTRPARGEGGAQPEGGRQRGGAGGN